MQRFYHSGKNAVEYEEGGGCMEDMVKELPTRQDIPAELKWRLEDMYASDAEWEQDFTRLKDAAEQMAALHGTLISAQGLLEVLRLRDAMGELNEKIFVYARMRRDEDNNGSKYQALSDRAASLSVQAASSMAFIVPEILLISPADLDRFFGEEPALQLYRHALEEITRVRPHILGTSEEMLLAQSEEVGEAAQNIFNMLNNADLRFPRIKDEQGQEVELTKGRYSLLMESDNRQVRHDAFKALYSSYQEHNNTLAATLNAAVKKDIFFARARKYGSALEASLDSDNVPIAVYDNLIATVKANLEPMYQYIRLRQKALGVDELHMYDLYAPLIKDAKFVVTYPEALVHVERGLAPLGSDYAQVLRQAFNSGWIDVMENKGKTSGAYSWGAFGSHPYVLLNWQDNVNNVFTLAHEMGHALHSYHSDQTQPYTYAGYRIFVAEVASTVNESLLMQHMLHETKDPKQRLYLLNYYLEQFRGTVYRQTMFAEFEKVIHAKVEAGEGLTTELLNGIYHALNKTYYGPDIIVDEEVDYEWSRIPHFYNNFYVYKYATGFSAATALSQQILQQGEPAVARYLDFLRSGGSDYPINLLAKAGVNMMSPQPIEAALKVFAGLVQEMEGLLEEKG